MSLTGTDDSSLPPIEPIDPTLSEKEQEKLKAFQKTLQNNLDKQKAAQEKADTANTKSYVEHYKDDMKSMWEQTKQTFSNAEVAKDEYEAFAQLLQYLLQLFAFASSPATQALNAAGEKAWAQMKESYHQRQADLQGEKYSDIEHQESRLNKLVELIEQSSNKIADLKARIQQEGGTGKAARLERQLAFENEKLKMLVEAKEKTDARITELKKLENPNEQTVTLDSAPDEPKPEDEILFSTTTTPSLQQGNTVHKPEGTNQILFSTTSTGPQIKTEPDPLGPLDDLLDTRSPPIVPQHRSTERSPIVNDTQLSIKEFHEKLKSLKSEQLAELGIKKFEAISPDASSTIKLSMYSTSDTSPTGKTTDVTVEHKPGTEGITYSMKKDMSAEEKLQTIEQICKLAVETAKPGTEFKVPSQDPERKAATEAALNKALKAKYPDYVEGKFKVPDNKRPSANLGH
ncbi:hypothetical protein [Candidatus Berkiella aquae]|uniref:Uncharacterized protein n=1 Tax=Candidatus Berkiella aquae TaxID=295108 RepID=A0A0Q9YSE6_9GAMM|nr:hypothetical protein [Candidatus Berkiella aquae]MCS5711686.1 hypothetical protein [Candidatus Berkiella aquae]